MPTKDQTFYFPLSDSGVHMQQGLPTDYPHPAVICRADRWRVGTPVANWATKIRNGENATSAMTAVWVSMKMKPGKSHSVRILYDWVNGPTNTRGEEWEDRVHCAVDSNHGDIRTGPNPTAASTTYADNQARVKFYKKLREQAVRFSAPTFLGELRETLHMIRRPASALYSKSKGYLDALDKAKRTNPKDWTKRLSGLWLEHSFGWLPLIHDAEDAQKALEQLVTGNPRASVVQGSYSDVQDKSSTLSGYERGDTAASGVCAFSKWRRYHSLHTQVIVRYKGKVNVTAAMTKWDNWALFGFTPSELVPTAWELLPWSFLVDYFVNVGDVLSSAVTSSANVVYVNKTSIQQAKKFGYWMFDPEASRLSWNTPGQTKEYSYDGVVSPEFENITRYVSRSPGSSVPLPTLQLHPGLSNGQLFNVAALLGQARALHQQNPIRPFRR